MKEIRYPEKAEWAALLRRPTMDYAKLHGVVRKVLDDVRNEGDAAVLRYERRFDCGDLASLVVTEEEMEEACGAVPEDLKKAVQVAHDNIHKFHAAQRFAEIKVEVCSGVTCMQKALPIESVGLYIPGGTAPLFSTVLMLAIPARIAGCKEIVLCTPPSQSGKVPASVLYAARTAGISRVYKAGGAQAVAAMAFGTETIPKVNKIFGPGNQYVTAAKQEVALQGTAIDMPAGPSEVAVLADGKSRADFVAADLLSQAEHGADSQVLLVCVDEGIAKKVESEVERQLCVLPRRAIAERALANSKIIVMGSVREAMELINLYAPEHLIIETEDYMAAARLVINAGSVFLGSYAPESAGDYASGTNHTLPTMGYAASYSGVNVDSFQRKVTFQHLTPQGAAALAPAVETMAAAEGLDGHRNAMALRRKAIEYNN